MFFTLSTGNCKYSDWGQWSKCGKTCDNGIQYRHRTILSQAWYGGIKCEMKNLKEQQSCNQEPLASFEHCF